MEVEPKDLLPQEIDVIKQLTEQRISCLLCRSDNVTKRAIYRISDPGIRASLNLAEDEVRSVGYCLCAPCQQKPDINQQVERKLNDSHAPEALLDHSDELEVISQDGPTSPEDMFEIMRRVATQGCYLCRNYKASYAVQVTLREEDALDLGYTDGDEVGGLLALCHPCATRPNVASVTYNAFLANVKVAREKQRLKDESKRN